MMSLKEEEDFNNENNHDIKVINEIKKKVNIMKKSKYRTTNFSLVEYFVNNNFQPLNKDFLIENLLIDYTKNPKRYILSKKNELFKSRETFKQSITHYIRHNNSFKEGPGKYKLSIDLENTLNYIRSVYDKYVNNSKDVKTPFKICRNSIINERKNKSQRNIVIKKEDDTDDFDIEIINDKKHSFSHNNYRKNNKSLCKNVKTFKNEELFDNNSTITLSDSSSSSLIKSEGKVQPKYEEKAYPEIFLKKLAQKTDFISSLDKKIIGELSSSTKDYIFNDDRIEGPKNVEENLINVDKSLKNIYDYSDSFEKRSEVLNCFQNKLLEIWKLMQYLLKVVKKGINKEIYRYEIYVGLKDTIIKYGITYKNILKEIRNILEKLKDLDVKSQEEIKILRKALFSINNRDFKALSDSIANYLNLDIDNYISDDEQSQENEESEDDYNYINKKNEIDEIISDFQRERTIILKEIENMDKIIGNITIY